MFRQLDKDEIEQLIQQQIVGRLGCHADDLSYVVPLSYGYDGEFLYGRTFEGKKLSMLRSNPRVCFQVDDTRDLSNWKSVICWGVVEELADKKDREKAIAILRARHIPLVPSRLMQLGGDFPFNVNADEIPGIFFRIRITEKTGMSEVSEAQEFYAS